MFRPLLVCLLMSYSFSVAAETEKAELKAPAGWGGETIKLPPGFARDMSLKGTEQIRFAPGMMRANSDSFFCYAFVFDLEKQPELSKSVVHAEFLKYYKGLCEAVAGGKAAGIDVSTFKLQLETIGAEDKSAGKANKPASPASEAVAQYVGHLDWVEPFATKKRQTLRLEIRTWTKNDRNFVFACVSPQPGDAKIWKQLRKIRDDYLDQLAQ